MRILITGGAGFIGSHIVDRMLESGHHVEVIDDLSSGVQSNVPPQVKLHKLQPEHYDKKTGILTISPYLKVRIAKRGNATRKSNNKKYAQCWLLECVFNSVKTMDEGVHIAKILDVSRSKIGNDEIKKVTNIVQEINEKITDANGPNNLIKLQTKYVFVNGSYL